MGDITIKVIRDDNIELCRVLCNELMAFQKSKAFIMPELFDLMHFDTRIKYSYEKALRKHVAVVFDDETPVGYVFSTIDRVKPEDNAAKPEWAPEDGKGFYPEWVAFTENIGCLNNLYLREEYRGMGLGKKLFDISMEWLDSFDDTDITFVFISNGNQAALDFYLKNGFVYSHDVFGGFIISAYKKKQRC